MASVGAEAGAHPDEAERTAAPDLRGARRLQFVAVDLADALRGRGPLHREHQRYRRCDSCGAAARRRAMLAPAPASCISLRVAAERERARPGSWQSSAPAARESCCRDDSRAEVLLRPPRSPHASSPLYGSKKLGADSLSPRSLNQFNCSLACLARRFLRSLLLTSAAALSLCASPRAVVRLPLPASPPCRPPPPPRPRFRPACRARR